MDATEENLTESHELIKNCTPEQWDSFEQHIEDTELVDLAAIAERIGASEQSTWKDYANTFCDYEWYQVIEAYYHITRKDY
jgi:hypothetical protein